MTRSRLTWRIAGIVLAVALILAWQLEANVPLISQIFLPGPDRVVTAVIRGLGGDLPARIAGTVERMIYSWLTASLVGVLVGAAIGLSSVLRAYLHPTLEFLRPLPASAVIPVAIPILGLTDTMVLAVTSFAALWPTLLATVQGFASVEPRLQEVRQVLRLGRLAYFWKIALPNALPDIMAGMRLSLTYALILSVVGEMLSGREGLGYSILYAARFYRSPDLFAGVIMLGVIGYVSARLLAAAERRLIPWRPA